MHELHHSSETSLVYLRTSVCARSFESPSHCFELSQPEHSHRKVTDVPGQDFDRLTLVVVEHWQPMANQRLTVDPLSDCCTPFLWVEERLDRLRLLVLFRSSLRSTLFCQRELVRRQLELWAASLTSNIFIVMGGHHRLQLKARPRVRASPRGKVSMSEKKHCGRRWSLGSQWPLSSRLWCWFKHPSFTSINVVGRRLVRETPVHRSDERQCSQIINF